MRLQIALNERRYRTESIMKSNASFHRATLGLSMVLLGSVATCGFGWLLSAVASFLRVLPYSWHDCSLVEGCGMKTYVGPDSLGGFWLWGVIGLVAAYLMYHLIRFIWIVCDEIGLIILKK